MKKVIIAIIVILLLCCGSIILLIFKGREIFPNVDLGFLTNLNPVSQTTSSMRNQVDDPFLEIKMVDFPGEISTICQTTAFVISAKNVGDKPLNYSDIVDSKYGFSLLLTTNNTIIADTTENSQGTHNLYLNDFGTLKAGETKQLSFYTKETYVGGEDFGGFQNGFNMMQNNGGNGSHPFMFEFYKINSSDSYTMMSNRPEFTVNIEAFEQSVEGYWSNKICN